MARLFFSGFETGDLSEWPTIAAGAAAQGTTIRSGAYALRCTADGDTATCIPFAAKTTLYFRTYLRISAAPGDTVMFARFLNGASNEVCYLAINTARRLCVVDGAFAVTTGATVLSTNTWYRVEAQITISGGGSTLATSVNLDGASELSVSGASAGSSQIDSFSLQTISLNGLTVSSNFFFDDCAVDDAALPGAGVVIARQALTGTPTYNTWTKTGGSGTIGSVWGDTPFSAATFAVSTITTGTSAQTGLTASFSTTQSGHGPETIGSGDTINAIKVGAIAKASSMANNRNLGAVRARFGGTDVDTNVTIATVDAYYESSTFTDTLTNLNSSEAGWNKRASGVPGTQTVEDVWVLVEYSPAPSGIANKALVLSQAIKRAAYW